MTWQDSVNGIYECIGGFFILLHCLRVWRDKKVRGVSIVAVSFFFTWGIWNLYYYPHLNQTISFLGGVHIVVWNLVYVISLLYFYRKEHGRKGET